MTKPNRNWLEREIFDCSKEQQLVSTIARLLVVVRAGGAAVLILCFTENAGAKWTSEIKS